MIDHISFRVKDYLASKAFFLAALKPLGYDLVMEFDQVGGLGAQGKPDFWLQGGEAGPPSHVAFAAQDRATVDAFYEAAIAAGAKDNGKPGLRPQYHAGYYGAFVIDPDGNNVEACCHRP